jgi:hypothetical protein
MKLKSTQVIGIEYQDDIYALGVSNMIIHGDGKPNIYLGSCFDMPEEIKKRFKPTTGFLNPPYKTEKTDAEELAFVLNNLSALERGGTCVAIIPLSCAIATKGDVYAYKKQLLEQHTLEAVMSMPEDLFHNSRVNVATCIFVITAHLPHPENKETWLGYWREDGFVKTKGKGRADLHQTWESIKQQWLTAYARRETIQHFSLMKPLRAGDEWCIENYLVADYDRLSPGLFKGAAERYLAYRLLNGLVDFKQSECRRAGSAEGLVPLSELFDVYNGIASARVELKEDAETISDIRYIRPSQKYEGSIAGYVDKMAVDAKYIFPEDSLYVSTDGQGSHSYAYVSSFEFVPNSNVAVLLPKRKDMPLQEKIYYALCITANRYKFSYGRKPKGERLKSILLPSCPPDFVYTDVFAAIFDHWKKIIK